MFEQIGDGLRAAKINQAMKAASAALEAGRIDIAAVRLEEAYLLSLKTKLPRMMLIELQTMWGIIGVSVRNAGYPDLADICGNMNKFLQSRFEAGDYYADPN